MVFQNVRRRRRKAIMKGMRFSVLSILCFLVIMPGVSRGDESDIFTADVPPDARLWHEELFVPLPRSVLVGGRSTPSGRPPLSIGEADAQELEHLLLD